MTPTQQPYDEWKQEVNLFLADHVDEWLQRAIEELRKRDRAISLLKSHILCHLDCRDCNGTDTLQQIEEVLK